MLEDHVRKSLTDAGIGSTLHDKSLADAGPEGLGLLDWLKSEGGSAIKQEGRNVILEGFSRTPAKLLARGLHINGVGVRVLNLTSFVNIRKYGGEKWEDILDCRSLFILPAQTERPCPLTPWQMEDVEYFLKRRMDQCKSVVLCMDKKQPVEPWWSDGFIEDLMDNCTEFNSSRLKGNTLK